MDWLVLFCFLQFGATPQNRVALYDMPAPYIYGEVLIYADASFSARIGGILELSGSVRTTMWKGVDDITFIPQAGEWNVGAALMMGPIFIGWNHFCTHPIVPYFPLVEEHFKWEGAYDEFYLRIGGEVKP